MISACLLKDPASDNFPLVGKKALLPSSGSSNGCGATGNLCSCTSDFMPMQLNCSGREHAVV